MPRPFLRSYFHLEATKPKPILLQQGTVRTNCMDNLDRTNVAQAAFAKWTLTRQLRALGILNESETIDSYDELVRDFRESMCLVCFVVISGEELTGTG